MRSRFHRIAALILLLAASRVEAGPCPPGDPQRPRTLVLALDGVPLRAVHEARRRGAFAGWPGTIPLVSTFPSLTNVAFTSLLEPLDVEPAGGYEVQHYDRQRNGVVGGSPFGYAQRLFAWRDGFDVTPRSVGGKLAIYTRPRRQAWKEVHQAERAVLESCHDPVLAHAGATDALMHLRGDERVVRFLIELDARLQLLKRRHLEIHGRPLRLVLLSDHGNSRGKVRAFRGLRSRLRQAGLEPRRHLRDDDDVIAATFGMVSYGALFLAEHRAETAARAIADLPGLDVVAWVSGPGQLTVLSADAEARVLWTVGPSGMRLGYVSVDGDPLRLGQAVEALTRSGRIDTDGLAPTAAWLHATLESDFPDAPRRLVDALTGRFVSNGATVLFSITPGRTWGWRAARYSSWLAGGRLEGTHGGLDRESSLAFLLCDDPAFRPGAALRLDEALVSLVPPGSDPDVASRKASATETGSQH